MQKRMKNKKNKKNHNKKTSLAFSLLIMSVIPIVIFGMIVSVYSSHILTKGMQGEVEKSLRSVAISLIKSYDARYEGDYKMDEYGNVLKGKSIISDEYSLLDTLKEDAGVDTALFFEATRAATSLLDEEGNRLFRTQISNQVIESVQNQGKEYFDTETYVNGAPYYGYYVPIKNNNESIVGMVFAGRPSSVVSSTINREVMKIVAIACIIIVFASIFSYLMGRRIVKSIKKVASSLEKVAEGNINIIIDNSILNQRNEIGSIGEATVKLRDSLRNVISNIMELVSTLSGSANYLKDTASHTSVIADEVSRAIEDISSGAIAQAEETQTASDCIATMGKLIKDIVNDVEVLKTNATKIHGG